MPVVSGLAKKTDQLPVQQLVVAMRWKFELTPAELAGIELEIVVVLAKLAAAQLAPDALLVVELAFHQSQETGEQLEGLLRAELPEQIEWTDWVELPD